MTTVRPEILWSPTNNDNFITWSTNIQLYEVQTVCPDDEIIPPKIRLSHKTAASLLATNSEYQYIKCVAWYNGSVDELSQQIIAVGQANGRVALTCFDHGSDSEGIIGKEFIPKPPRPVNALTWNQQYHQWLAVGLDKAARDASIVMLDVTKGISASVRNVGFAGRNPNTSDVLKPFMEWGSGETTHSVEFSKQEPQVLIAGINNKVIRLHDLRDDKPIGSIQTKAVYGICSDPLCKERFASHIDNVVYIWDARNIIRPVLTLQNYNSKSIHKLLWCPTRYGFLGSLSRESAHIRLFDIQQQTLSRDEEPPVIRRLITAESNSFISSFAWHPYDENRVITASYAGKILDHIVHERVTLNWSVMNNLAFSHGKKTVNFLNENSSLFESLRDISTIIKERALNEYGLHRNDLSLNGKVTRDPSLQNLWLWLQEARQLANNPSFRIDSEPYNYQGIMNVISSDNLNSKIILQNWEGIDSNKISPAKVYSCEERSIAISLCLWFLIGDEEESLLKFLDQMEANKEFTRASAVAVFNLKIPHAIRILNKGAVELKDPSLNTTAMALAGFTSDSKALWRETCSHLLKQFDDPYLKITFSFLTSENKSYCDILHDKRIFLHDRVAFACKYLSDSKLYDFLQRLTAELSESGDLQGIFLTGLCSEGYELMQRYVDITGDVQTPSLIAVHMLKNDHDSSSRVQHWIDSYRALLDSLQLWNERAHIDVIMNHTKEMQKIPHQVYISCNFCSKSTTSSIGRSRLPFARFGTGAASKLKITSCPNCKKPLPRCSLCLQHMGTPSKRGSVTAKSHEEYKCLTQGGPNALQNSVTVKALSKFSSWFSWCQACRHGGHAQHMIQWFKEHSECPVTSCGCKCMTIDSFNKSLTLK